MISKQRRVRAPLGAVAREVTPSRRAGTRSAKYIRDGVNKDGMPVHTVEIRRNRRGEQYVIPSRRIRAKESK